MKLSRLIRYNKYRPILLAVAIIMLVIGALFDKVSERRVTLSTPVESFELNIEQAFNKAMPIVQTWISGTSIDTVRSSDLISDYKQWLRLGVSIYLYEGSENKIWRNDKISGDLRELTSGEPLDRLFKIDGRTMLIFKEQSADSLREVIIALELHNGALEDGLNRSIFNGKDIMLIEKDYVNPDLHHKVEVMGTVFWCSKDYQVVPSIIASLIGWGGMLLFWAHNL